MDAALFVEAFMKLKASLLYFLIFCFSLTVLFAQKEQSSPFSEITVAGKMHDILSHNITVEEYCFFLNAVAVNDDFYDLYDQKMGSDPTTACIIQCKSAAGLTYFFIEGRENNLVPYLNWFRAARFCNWVKNKQPTTDQDPSITEYGIYNLKETADEFPRMMGLSKKSNHYLLAGDEIAAINYQIPDSFWSTDPFIGANNAAIPMDLMISTKKLYGIEKQTKSSITSCLSGAETIGKDLLETLTIAFTAAILAGASILAVGALSGYAVAGFVGTALAARSASDKVITKVTTKTGVQAWYWELLSGFGSIAIGMLLGAIMTTGILTPAALVLASTAAEVDTGAAAIAAAPEETYIFGLFRRATGQALKDFQHHPLRTLFASLWGSAVGAHLSTHLDPTVAKALDNTKAP